ncbi:MAG: hypothetical protein NTX97_06900 [Bacteroidetes bacterium]|nr:hypothetical protein [Bacteroidota bacterium]
MIKKILFTVSALALFFISNAQEKKVETWPNGNKKSEGIIIGNGTVDPNASKEVQQRQAVNIVKDGKWSTWFENGTIRTEEYYKNGSMIGAWKVWYDNGQLESDINFTTGQATYFHKNGKKQSEGGIVNGMINTGKWIGYFENGVKNYEGTYTKEGQKDGVWTWYDEKGAVTVVQTYLNGELVK